MGLAGLHFGLDHGGDGAGAGDECDDLGPDGAHPGGVLAGPERIAVAAGRSKLWLPDLIRTQHLDHSFRGIAHPPPPCAIATTLFSTTTVCRDSLIFGPCRNRATALATPAPVLARSMALLSQARRSSATPA